VTDSSVATAGEPTASYRRQVKMSARQRAGNWAYRFLPLISLGTFIVILEVLGRMEVSRIIPPFSEVVRTLIELWQGGHLESFGLSLQALGIGFGLSLVLGLVVGVVTTASKTLDYVLEPYINGFMSIPTSALIPVLMLLFGMGLATRIVVVFLYGFFVIAVNTQAGLRQVDPALHEMARAFGAKGWIYLRKVTIPTALPLILTGIRLGISRSFKGMVNSETVISITGIGALIIRFGRTFDVAGLYAVILLILLLAIALTSIIEMLESRFVKRAG
jgi:NitT/TauT family transport system permease protein